jgi:raffinose/stachyose/melibiose transport system permease protein
VKRGTVQQKGEYAVFVLPALIYFIAIFILPFFHTAYISMRNWDGISPDSLFIGIENYLNSFSNSNFIKSLKFTVKFSLVNVISTNLIGFFLAFILTRGLLTQNILRAIYFIPHMLSGLVTGFIWRFIYDTTYKQIVTGLGLDFLNINWFSLPNPAFTAVCITFAWHYSGYLMVIYIAALQGIPEDMLDSAKVDGATGARILWSIILPMIRHAFTICLFLSLSTTFKSFDLIMSLTAGGPFGTTASLAYNIYSEAFTYHRYGLGSAEAVLFFFILAVITVIQLSVMKKREIEA